MLVAEALFDMHRAGLELNGFSDESVVIDRSHGDPSIPFVPTIVGFTCATEHEYPAAEMLPALNSDDPGYGHPCTELYEGYALSAVYTPTHLPWLRTETGIPIALLNTLDIQKMMDEAEFSPNMNDEQMEWQVYNVLQAFHDLVKAREDAERNPITLEDPDVDG
ncbi:hypothetical protein C8T65DRAFT_746043 [Cerioporus squamosus]|nr:hypothetical protein C8T65DRAFT_746043 [Cerioporus squamosus]